MFPSIFDNDHIFEALLQVVANEVFSICRCRMDITKVFRKDHVEIKVTYKEGVDKNYLKDCLVEFVGDMNKALGIELLSYAYDDEEFCVYMSMAWQYRIPTLWASLYVSYKDMKSTGGYLYE